MHVFVVVDRQGASRRVVVPGGYCADVRPSLRDGERVVDRTWRSHIKYLDHPSNSEPEYQREVGTVAKVSEVEAARLSALARGRAEGPLVPPVFPNVFQHVTEAQARLERTRPPVERAERRG